MEKEIKLVNQNKCTGCAACSNACPTESISFVASKLHYYPTIKTETCIKCGKCMQACSPLNWEITHATASDYVPSYYCAWNSNENERMSATSGGIGGAMAEQALRMSYYVCGAAFDGDWKLHHIVSNEKSIVERIRGSKYLQSNTDGVYKEIVSLLKKGNNVLFLGTPCQTDALRNLVPAKSHELLLTCEIICHGVNSPIVWNDYIFYIEKVNGSRVLSYNFRSKSNGWGKLRTSYSFKNGKKKNEPGWKNIFHRWFGQHYMMRESCFRCQYRTILRYSDIIIGDFWGIETIEPKLDVKRGASVVIENTKKGKDFLTRCKLNKKLIETDKALEVIKGFVDMMPENVKTAQITKMKSFEEDYLSHSFEEMARKKYPAISIHDKYIKSILYHLHLSK